MKIVNNSKLPQAIFDFLCQDFYDHEEVGDSYSATTLLKPVQEIVLTKRFKDKVEVEASDRIWSLFGSGVHAVLEKLQGSDIVNIERMKFVVDGFTVSGKYDLIKGNKLSDYKVTSAWNWVYSSKDKVKDWGNQMSIYRWLYFKTKGIMLDDMASAIVIFRDYNKKDLWLPNFPQAPIMEVEIELHPIEKTEKAIKLKLEKIKKALELKDDELPECTPAERWYSSKTKKFNKCEGYCLVRQFCQQNKK